MKKTDYKDYQSFNKILDKDFEDLYVIPWKNKMAIKNGNDIQEQIMNYPDGLLKEVYDGQLAGAVPGQAFSIEYKNKPLRVQKTVSWDICIRKLSKPADFLDVVIKRDNVLTNFLSKVLGSNEPNKSLIISGTTGAGKTTFILSLLEFLNSYDINSYKNHFYVNYLASQWAFTDQNAYKKTIHDYNHKEIKEKAKEIVGKNSDIVLKELDDLYKKMDLIPLIKRYNSKVVYTIENPIEYFFKDKDLLFIQNELQWAGKTTKEVEDLKKSMAASFRSNPDLVYISEVRKKEAYLWLLDMFESSFPVIWTLHADDVFQSLTKIIERWKAGKRTNKGIKTAITSWVGGMLHFKRYATMDNVFLSSYELLEFSDNDSIKEAFKNRKTVQRFKDYYLSTDRVKNSHYYYVKHNNSLLYKLFQYWSRQPKWKGVIDVIEWDYEHVNKVLFSLKNIRDMTNIYYWYSQTATFENKELESFKKAYLDFYNKKE